tara:strand:+ start:7138 stop:7575 length:438 start_codon:yes stop_codon:yes gene_type:complete
MLDDTRAEAYPEASELALTVIDHIRCLTKRDRLNHNYNCTQWPLRGDETFKEADPHSYQHAATVAAITKAADKLERDVAFAVKCPRTLFRVARGALDAAAPLIRPWQDADLSGSVNREVGQFYVTIARWMLATAGDAMSKKWPEA